MFQLNGCSMSAALGTKAPTYLMVTALCFSIQFGMLRSEKQGLHLIPKLQKNRFEECHNSLGGKRIEAYTAASSSTRFVNLRGGSNIGSYATEWIKNLPPNFKGDVLNISRTPMVAMDELVGKEVVVALEEGMECTGILECCDEDFNVWLKGTVERRDANTGNLIEKKDGMSMFIRGSNVVHIGLLQSAP
jgi:small nuclear ribonucleoprotein (snRNP)-like protein